MCFGFVWCRRAGPVNLIVGLLAVTKCMNRAFSRGLLASTLIVALAAIADGGGNGVMRLVNTCSSCYGVECGLAPPDWSPERQLLVDRLRRQLPDPCYVTDCSSVAKRDLNKDGHAEYFVPVSCG